MGGQLYFFRLLGVRLLLGLLLMFVVCHCREVLDREVRCRLYGWFVGVLRRACSKFLRGEVLCGEALRGDSLVM